MESSFWHKRWRINDIGFHENQANSLLVKHIEELSLADGSCIFIPLCGKTRDISWLVSNGYRVVGVELSRMAVEQLFEENRIDPKVSDFGKLVRYSAKNLEVFVGDIFDLSRDTLGPVDAIYDRAALVALPENMRKQYTEHLVAITDKKQQLLICFEYEQSLMPGPPFSINSEEVYQQYKVSYDIALIESIDVKGDLKGKCPATENAWLLRNE